MTDAPAHKPGAVDAGVFVAAFILLLVSLANGWGVIALLAGLVLIGVMVTTAARRQLGGGQRPRKDRRPWQQGDN